MFIGHYGPAFAAKAVWKPIPLWLLFIAVQFMDVVWSIFVFLGVEKLRIVHGFTASNALDLYYMPYTHGLIGALCLSVLLGAVSEAFLRQRGQTFLVVAVCVFSHWLLDLIVHMPDMPLIGDTMKVGFGLWRWRDVSLVLEFTTLFAGMWVYMRAVPSQTKSGDTWLWGMSGALVIAHLYNTFGPDPASPRMAAGMALVAYLLFAGFAWQVDRARGAAATSKVPIAQLSI